MNEEIKNKVKSEIISLFHEVYSGVEYPKIDSKKIEYFVSKALDRYEAELFYAKKLKD